MTPAEQLRLATSKLAPLSAPADKVAFAAAARLGSKALGGLVRHGGNALGYGLRRFGNLGRVVAGTGKTAPGALGQTGTFARAAAPVAASAEGRFVSSVGRSIQRGSQRAADAISGWGSRAPVAGPAAPIVNPKDYGFGLRSVNRALDSTIGRSHTGARALATARRWNLMPTSAVGALGSPALTLPLLADRYGEAGRMQDAGNYAAARTLHELRQSPFSLGLPALMAPSGMVERSLAHRGYGGMADHFQNMVQDPGYVDSMASQLARSAYIPGYHSLFR